MDESNLICHPPREAMFAKGELETPAVRPWEDVIVCKLVDGFGGGNEFLEQLHSRIVIRYVNDTYQ